MKRINLIMAVVLVVQLGLVVAIYLGKSDAGIAKLKPILELEAATVNKIEIFAKDAKEENDGAPTIVLDRKSGTWQLASHFDYPASGAKVDELVTKLAGMKAREPVATKAATHKKFAVSDESYERRVILQREVGEPIEIYIGAGAGQRQTAVRLKGQDTVYGAAGITAWGIGTGVTSWLEPSYYKQVGGIASLTSTNESGEVELRRDAEGAWKRYAGDAEVPVPEGKVLDTAKVAGLGNTFANINLLEPAEPASSFSAPVLTVVFKGKGDDKEHTLVAGADKDGRTPIRIDEQPPVWVSTSVLKSLIELKGEALYRDPPKEGETPPPPSSGAPTDLSQLPPDILRQLQEQGIAPP